MPRPKPADPLKGRSVRLSDRHWVILHQIGGLDWLRRTLDRKSPMPKPFYTEEKLNELLTAIRTVPGNKPRNET
jgi:hypothetical protein